MNRRDFFFTACFARHTQAFASVEETRTCMPIHPESRSDQHAYLQTDGCYALAESFDQRWLYVFAEGGRRGPHHSEMIKTTAHSVEIDFCEYGLTTSTYIDGFVAALKNLPGDSEQKEHKVELKNGFINLNNSDKEARVKGGTGIIIPDRIGYIHNDLVPAIMPESFGKVSFLIENMKIKAASAAAMLMGDGITIRNCTIEADCENALVIYGPNAVIENNHIKYKFRPGISSNSMRSKYPKLPAAIYLRASNNTVVQGNTISVLGDQSPSDVSAVAVVDSSNVTIQDNSLQRGLRPIVRVGGTPAQLRNNSTAGHFSGTQILPDGYY